MFLPYRMVEEVTDAKGGLGRRTGNVPFYTCGDQQHSCEALSQPVS